MSKVSFHGPLLRRAFALLGSLALLLAATPSLADFRDGLADYGAGRFAEAEQSWTAAADAGDTRAQYRLGLLLIYGMSRDPAPEEGLQRLRQAAAGGQVLAMRDLGSLLFEGERVTQDYAEAMKWNAAGAELGDPQCIFQLALQYDRGLGIGLDYDKALELYEQAAEAGLPAAQRRVGQYYAAGITVPVDLEVATGWLKRASEGGDAHAQFELAELHERGNGVPQSYAKAFLFLRLAAEGSLAEAQANLANFYLHRSNYEVDEQGLAKPLPDPAGIGLGEEPDLAEAEFWLRRAAAQNVLLAQVNLANFLASIAKPPVDYFEAFDLLGQARRQHSREADATLRQIDARLPREYSFNQIKQPNEFEPAAYCMLSYAVEAWDDLVKKCGSFARYRQVVPLYVLGLANEKGFGIPVDPVAAIKFYAEAGRYGYPRAQNAVGRMLLRGQGVDKNLREGAQWVGTAAAQGYPPAQFNFGFMHETGLGVPQSPVAAANWYRRAAERGHARAQYNLATHMLRGSGISENPVEACKWLILAATPQGVDGSEGLQVRLQAERLRRQVEAGLTPAQIDSARRQAVAFRPRT